MAIDLIRCAAACLVLGAAHLPPIAAMADPAPEAGRKLFTGAQPPCALCHTLADAGATGSVGPVLDELKPDAARVAAAITNGIGVMPPYENLSPEEIAAVAAYVAGAAGAR